MAKGKLRMELERSYHALGTLFPGQRSFVESFFLKGSTASEGEGDASAGPGEELPPSPGGGE